jgi:hypothetical protein
MTKAQRTLLVVLAFLAGCGGSQAARLVVPVARASTPVQRWEYDCRYATDHVTDISNQLGQQGWELVAAAGAGPGLAESSKSMVWCFKRALP